MDQNTELITLIFDKVKAEKFEEAVNLIQLAITQTENELRLLKSKFSDLPEPIRHSAQELFSSVENTLKNYLVIRKELLKLINHKNSHLH